MVPERRPIERLARITAEVDRAASRELVRKLQDLEFRLDTLERGGGRSASLEADAIRVRALEGRMVDLDAAMKGLREEMRDLRSRIEGVSTEVLSRINSFQIGQQETRRLLEERAGPLRGLEAELKGQAARTEGMLREVEERLVAAEPALRRAAQVAEALGPDGAAVAQRIPEAVERVAALDERVQAVERAAGQMAAQTEGLLRAGEEMAATLEEVKRAVDAGGPGASARALEERLAVLEREAGKWEDLGEVLLSLRQGLDGFRKEAAQLEEVRRQAGAVEAHEREISRISTMVEELLRSVDELRQRPPPAAADPEVERRLEEHEKTLQRFAGVAEEVLKWMEAMEEQRRVLDEALHALKESSVERRLQEVELAQAKASGIAEHLLKQVDELEAAMERLRRVVLQQTGT